MKSKILIVVGTRPNFIKVTLFQRIASRYPDFGVKIVHTGQHFDKTMSDVFFKQFNLSPDYHLNIPPSSPTTQMAKVMLSLEKLINNQNPDLIIVTGDVNSTLAAALAANKCHVKLAHIESGLRSFDRTMPEEFNRILTDELADYLFVTEQSGMDNLILEGKDPDNIFFIGNTMIDAIVAFEKQIEQSEIMQKYDLKSGEFVLMTMHRPSVVDNKDGLIKLLDIITNITEKYKLVFPIHPRTIKNLKNFKLLRLFNNIKNIIAPMPLDYFAFQKLILNSKFILTDSGGIQEESTFRKIPCLTLRSNTERPVTVEIGTNTLVPFDKNILWDCIRTIENGTYKKGNIPPLWDGQATVRIMEIINRVIN